jgi:hypothetical protein
MGLISGKLFKNLEVMKDIRNRFAHRTEIGSFDHPEISSRCFNLTLVNKYAIDPPNGIHGDPAALFAVLVPGAAEKSKNAKERYALSAQIFSMGLQEAAGFRSPPDDPLTTVVGSS